MDIRDRSCRVHDSPAEDRGCFSNGVPDRNSIGTTQQGESLGPSRKKEDYKNYNWDLEAKEEETSLALRIWDVA